MAKLEFNNERLAASIYRVWCGACGITLLNGSAISWDQLSFAEHDPWFAVARGAINTITACEGKTWREASESLARLCPLVVVPPDGRDMVAWQAVARHLVTLIDAEDVDSVADVEAYWVNWAKEQQLPAPNEVKND